MNGTHTLAIDTQASVRDNVTPEEVWRVWDERVGGGPSGDPTVKRRKYTAVGYERHLVNGGVRDLIEHMQWCPEMVKWEPYKRVYGQKKSDGTRRPIDIPSYEVHLASALLLKEYRERMDMPQAIQSEPSRPGKARGRESVYRAVTQQCFRKHVVKVDIEAFFESIGHLRLDRMLSDLMHFRDAELASHLLRLPVFERIDGRDVSPDRNGIPQGNPISPFIAACMLRRLPQRLERIVEYQAYYVDDFLMLCDGPSAAMAAYDEVARYLDTLGLTIDAKSVAQAIIGPDEEFEFLGYQFRAAAQKDTAA